MYDLSGEIAISKLISVSNGAQMAPYKLQRLAHEDAGYGPWEKCDEEIPLVEDNVKLATMDLSDTKHPRLKKRPEASLHENWPSTSASERDKCSVARSLHQRE